MIWDWLIETGRALWVYNFVLSKSRMIGSHRSMPQKRENWKLTQFKARKASWQEEQWRRDRIVKFLKDFVVWCNREWLAERNFMKFIASHRPQIERRNEKLMRAKLGSLGLWVCLRYAVNTFLQLVEWSHIAVAECARVAACVGAGCWCFSVGPQQHVTRVSFIRFESFVSLRKVSFRVDMRKNRKPNVGQIDSDFISSIHWRRFQCFYCRFESACRRLRFFAIKLKSVRRTCTWFGLAWIGNFHVSESTPKWSKGDHSSCLMSLSLRWASSTNSNWNDSSTVQLINRRSGFCTSRFKVVAWLRSLDLWGWCSACWFSGDW
jgi:hypothetical protein